MVHSRLPRKTGNKSIKKIIWIQIQARQKQIKIQQKFGSRSAASLKNIVLGETEKSWPSTLTISVIKFRWEHFQIKNLMDWWSACPRILTLARYQYLAYTCLHLFLTVVVTHNLVKNRHLLINLSPFYVSSSTRCPIRTSFKISSSLYFYE